MITKLVGIATLFAAGTILVAGTPTLGAKALDNQASASRDLRCGHGGGGGRRCATVPSCAARVCGMTRPTK
jgi:hypothetical protein